MLADADLVELEEFVPVRMLQAPRPARRRNNPFFFCQSRVAAEGSGVVIHKVEYTENGPRD